MRFSPLGQKAEWTSRRDDVAFKNARAPYQVTLRATIVTLSIVRHYTGLFWLSGGSRLGTTPLEQLEDRSGPNTSALCEVILRERP
jgi:hypothetical protein